jgi:hypothetical protein
VVGRSENMKVYLVMVTSIATKENTNFKGQESITYHGVGDRLIAHYGSHAVATHDVQKLDLYMVEKYGYTRKCDVKRNWSYKNPENSKYWKSIAEIVEIDIDIWKRERGIYGKKSKQSLDA